MPSQWEYVYQPSNAHPLLTVSLLDAFALNIGDPTPDWVDVTLDSLFGYAEYRGFKLFIIMDLYASGDACYKIKSSCNNVKDYEGILTYRLGSPAYYKAGPRNLPMVSTFSSGGLNNTHFKEWREQWGQQIYFVPNFDETLGYWEADPEWYKYWGDVSDGLSSWESSWPQVHSTKIGDMSRDNTVIAGTLARGKSYMTGLSLCQYKNAYGTNLYRGGELNLPARMEGLLAMGTRPDFIQLQTWNDGPEGHHIGNLWIEQNIDEQPLRYASQAGSTHKGLQPLLTSFSNAFKNGGNAASMRPPGGAPVGVLWYKTIFQDTKCGLDGSYQMYFNKPNGSDAGRDQLNWAVVVPDGVNWHVNLISGQIQVGGAVALHAGLNYGSAPMLNEGAQVLVVYDASNNEIAYTQNQRCATRACTDGIYNYMPQVAPLLSTGSVSKRGFKRAADTVCWQCQGTAQLDEVNARVTGLTVGPVIESASCNDLKGRDADTQIDKSFWEGTSAGSLLSWWRLDNYNFDSDWSWFASFTRSLGMAQSLATCTVGDPCKLPDCLDMEDPQNPGTGWKYLVVLSVVNLNTFFFNIYMAIDDAVNSYSLSQANLKVTFQNDDLGANLFEKDLLAGVAGVVSIAAVIAGPVPKVIGAFVAFFSALMTGVSNSISAQNVEMKTLAQMEMVVKNWRDSIRDAIEKANVALIQGDGTVYLPPAYLGDHIENILMEGDWVDYRAIPVVAGTKVTRTYLANYFHNLLNAQSVNLAWQSQGVYLACRDMTQDEFDSNIANAGDNDPRLKYYHEGTGCFYQSIIAIKHLSKVAAASYNPKGWGEIPNTANQWSFGTDTIIKSSLASWKAGGNKYNSQTATTRFDTIMSSDFSSASLDTLLQQAGTFTLPICLYQVGTGISVKDFFHDLNNPGTINTGGSGSWGPICRCYNTPDPYGSTIADAYPDIKKLMGLFCNSDNAY